MPIDEVVFHEPNSSMTILSPLGVPPHEEANHRIANSLQLLSALVSLQAQESSDELTRHTLELTQQRIAAVAGVHRHLYRSGSEHLVDIADYLGDLARGLEEGCGSGSVRRCIAAEIVSTEVPTEVATSLGLMVTELVLNACKHAYALDEPGSIRIRLYRDEAGASRLEVCDDGKGRRAAPNPAHKGLGSRIIDAMARGLGAEYAYIESDWGTRFALKGYFLPRAAEAVVQS
jgi:two-component sensor histidine kinase